MTVRYYAQVKNGRRILLNGCMHRNVSTDQAALDEARRRHGDDLIRVTRTESKVVYETKKSRYYQ